MKTAGVSGGSWGVERGVLGICGVVDPPEVSPGLAGKELAAIFFKLLQVYEFADLNRFCYKRQVALL